MATSFSLGARLLVMSSSAAIAGKASALTTTNYMRLIVMHYSVVVGFEIACVCANFRSMCSILPKQTLRHDGRAKFGWSHWPHQSHYTLPIPTSKKSLYWRLVGPTCLVYMYAGENTDAMCGWCAVTCQMSILGMCTLLDVMLLSTYIQCMV